MIDPTASLKLLDNLLTRDRGTKRMLVLETWKNMTILEFVDCEVPVDTIIAKIEIGQLKKALESNFDFRSFSILKPKVHKRTARNNPFYERYVGWTTEDLFRSIYSKIDDLKTIVSLDPQPAHIDKKARLMNIYKLMNLLLLHLNKKRIKDVDSDGIQQD